MKNNGVVPKNNFLLTFFTQKGAFFLLPSILFPVVAGLYVMSLVELMQNVPYTMYGKRLR